MNKNLQGKQIDLFSTGAELRDKGIKQAIDHADAVHDQWSERAYRFLKQFIETHDQFTSEDVRLGSAGVVPDPPDDRAWGGVIGRGKRSGLIKKNGFGYAKDPKAHCRPAQIWERIKK